MEWTKVGAIEPGEEGLNLMVKVTYLYILDS